MPLPALARTLAPAVEAETLDAASRLRFRDFLIVVLIVNRAELFPDNWLYIHSPDVKVGRIQNFKNWSAAMVPDPSTTSVGMEYFCSADDDVWKRDDADLIAMATGEIDQLGLAPAGAVVDGCVIRQRKAYPVYDDSYRLQVERIREGLSGLHEPADDRPQRHAPLQQPGSLDAHRHAGGAQCHGRTARPLGRQHGALLLRGAASHRGARGLTCRGRFA